MKFSRFVFMFIVVLGLAGCMSPEQAQGLANEAEQARSMLEVFQEEVAGLKSDLAAIAADDPDAAETADKILAIMESKTAEAEKWVTALSNANEQLSQAEGGWEVLETLTGLAAGFFPPVAIAVPFIRRSRRMFNGVVDAVAAGGGVKNAEDTRKAMLMVAGLKDRVTNRRVEIGDKEMKAVKVS